MVQPFVRCKSTVFAAFCLVVLAHNCSSAQQNNAPVAAQSGVPAPASEVRLKSAGNLRFLGQQDVLDRHSLALPHRQYDVSVQARPNKHSAVIFSNPETPFVDIKSKYPQEGERLRKWFAEWDAIQARQKLAMAYQKSYHQSSQAQYIDESGKVQSEVVLRLHTLQQNSWPNSDLRYQAYTEKIRACQRLALIRTLGYYAGKNLADNTQKFCVLNP